MGAATFRFYGELNDFLEYRDRQREVTVTFDVAPSVKDAIEGVGVPHTEVDVIVANGDVVGFDRRLADGDRIAVYPAFRSIDARPVERLRTEMPRDRFVLDGHLAVLARHLRLLGFDTVHDDDWDDATLVDVARREHRLLLTRDRGLLKRSAVEHGMFVRDDDPDDQVVDVAKRLRLGSRARPFTRCTVCNGDLIDVDKSEVETELEPRTREYFDEFRRCASCGRIYWKGSHFDRLLAVVRSVEEA